MSHEGRVFLSRPLHLTLFCDMDLALFPFDKQRCDFTVGAWAYDGLGVEIWPSRGGRDLRDSTWLDLDSLGDIEEYDLVKVLADRAETYYSCCPGTPYYALRYTLVLKRRSRFYIWCLMFPLFMSTLIGFLTFLVNPAAGERIGLGITVVLTIVAILWIVVDILPKNNVVTFLQKIYLSSFATALLTLMVSIVTVSLCLVTSEDNGMKSRRTLLDAFFSADEDNDGVLDQHELRKAVRSLGLSDKEMKQVLRLCGRDPVPFDVWDAVVDKICQANVFATSHNFLIGGLLKHFIDRKHRRRVGAVKRRSLMKQRASSISPEPRTDAPPRPPRLDDAGSTKALDATDSTRSVVGADSARSVVGADSARSVVGGSEGDLLGALTDGIFRPPGDDGGGDPGEKYEWNPPLERFDSGRSSVFLADKGVVEENDTKELTEEIGRALAGKIDMAAGLLLPALYIGYVFFLCLDLGFPLPGHVPKASVEVLYNASQPTVLYY